MLKYTKRLLLLLFLSQASLAFATVPEIPGNGIDDGASSGTKGSCPPGYADAVIGNGCDLLLSGPDKDNDGYPANQDCDDTNRNIIPNEYYACDAGGGATSGYRQCQSNGTWGSCISNSTPLCEATGTGVCKYIDCGTGNNSNTGTYASPYQTLGKVAGGASGSIPASPYTLQPGDVVYIKGTGSCTNQYVDGGPSNFLQLTQSGTSSNKITIKRYPGSIATIVSSGGGGIYSNTGVDYNVLKDLDISTGSTSTSNAPIYLVGTEHWEVSRVYLHDSAGNGDNNFACFLADGNNTIRIHHSFLKNCKRFQGNIDNVVSILFMDDKDNVNEGHDQKADHNVIWHDTYSNTSNSICWKNKHGPNIADTGTNGYQIEDSYCINGRVALLWEGAGLRARRIFAYTEATGQDPSTSVQLALTISPTAADGTNDSDHGDNIVEDSTFVNYSRVSFWPSYNSVTTQKLTWRRNILYDNDPVYSAGNSDGFVSIDAYGNDTQEGQVRTNNNLAFNNNCYFNSAGTTPVFAFFSITSGGGGHGPAGNAGGNYSFAQWQSNVSQDANSSIADPSFDQYYRATNTTCADKGWLKASESYLYSKEICGSGVDEASGQVQSGGNCPAGYMPAKVGNGCDLKCPAPDADNDGFNDSTLGGNDCDDSDKFIYPGVLTAKGCSAGQARTCQADGTYTACAAIPCEATGGGSCKYFSPSGSNTTGDGSFGNPWKDLSKVSYWYYTLTPPFTLYTPQQGDVFYMRGGTYTQSYGLGYYGRHFVCRNGTDAAAATPIKIKSYPGEWAVIKAQWTSVDEPAGAATMYIEGCDGWVLENFEIDGSDQYGNGLEIAGSDRTTVRNVISHGMSGEQNNNLSAFVSRGDGNTWQSVIGYDAYERNQNNPSKGSANNVQMVVWRSKGTSVRGSTFFFSTYQSQGGTPKNYGICFKQKHADYDSNLNFTNNVVYNCLDGATQFAGGNLAFYNNRVYNSSTGVVLADLGGTSYQVGLMDIRRNFFKDVGNTLVINPQKSYNIDGSSAPDACSGNYTFGTVQFWDNVVVDNRTAYNTEQGLILADTYGSDPIYSAFIGAGKLKTNNNLYYNSNSVAASFALYASNNGVTTCSGRGNLGQTYTLAQWQAAGFDTAASGSVVENPNVNAYDIPTSANSKFKGWRVSPPDYTKTQEICGDGVDNVPSGFIKGYCPQGWMDAKWGNGCDLKCAKPDEDRDAYWTVAGGPISGLDCDDNDRGIYPGIRTTKGCSAGQSHLCQSDGTYTACSASQICEATGSGRCFYINTDSGSDSNACSWASPCASFTKFTTGSGTISLIPGDRIYVLGNTTMTNFSTRTPDGGDGGNRIVFEAPVDGTATDKIGVLCYPGYDCKIDPPFDSVNSGYVFKLWKKNYILRGFHIFGSYGSAVGTSGCDNCDVSQMHIHDIQGSGANNIACITGTDGDNVSIHHNRLYDCYDPTKNTLGADRQNVSLIVNFAGSNRKVNDNILFYTIPPSSTPYEKAGKGYKFKHGGTGLFEFKRNIVTNTEYCIGNHTQGSRITNNFCATSNECYEWVDLGGQTYPKDNIFDNNTCIILPNRAAGGTISYNPVSTYIPIEGFTARYNVLIDTFPSAYTSEVEMLRIANYGSDTDYDAVMAGNNLVFDHNCYYNPNFDISASSNFMSLFGDNTTGQTPRRDQRGAYYTFPGWQSLSKDSNSFVKFPFLDVYGRALDTDCQNKGWQQITVQGSEEPPAAPPGTAHNFRVVRKDRRIPP